MNGKQLYVRGVRVARAVAARTGLLRILEVAARRSRTAHWLRTLFAIYDLEDLVGLDVPWWTYEAIDAVADHLRGNPQARVLEWGSGASTVWLAARAPHVVAIEHDPEWARHVASHLPGAGSVMTVPSRPSDDAGPGATVPSAKPGFEGQDFSAYVHAVDDVAGELDLVVIDGRAREACLEQALPRLAPGGLIVFDNVDRQRYRDAIAAQPGLDVRWTRGLTPCLPYPTRTALIRVAQG